MATLSAALRTHAGRRSAYERAADEIELAVLSHLEDASDMEQKMPAIKSDNDKL